MSIDATRWAWQLKVSPSQKLVLLSMADRAGETHECWPSVARLESDTGLDRKTILSAIEQLEQAGFLVVLRVLGRGNKYQLLGVDGRETSTKNGTGTSTKNGTGEDVLTSPKNGTPQSQKRDGYQSQKRDTESTNESINKHPTACEPVFEKQNLTTAARPKTPSMAGEVCMALKALGMAKVNPGNMVLKTLIDGGASLELFAEAGTLAVSKGKGFEYMLAVVSAKMTECADLAANMRAAASAAPSGILPGAI